MLRVTVTLRGEAGDIVREGVGGFSLLGPFLALYYPNPNPEAKEPGNIMALYHTDAVLAVEPEEMEEPRVKLATAVPRLQVPDRMKT